jgi:hypothetical protein
MARSSSALYPHTGRARLGDEHVSRLELDVVRDRVRPGASRSDLSPVARLRPAGRAELAAKRVTEHCEHRERGLVPGAQTRLGLRPADACVVLEEAMRMRTPASTFANQRDLVSLFRAIMCSITFELEETAASARVRSTSNSGTKISASPLVLCANAIGRSFEGNQKPVKYWMESCPNST